MRTKKAKIQEIVNLALHPEPVPEVAPEDREFLISKGFNFNDYRAGKATLIIMDRYQERAERILKDFDQDKIHMLVIEVVEP